MAVRNVEKDATMAEEIAIAIHRKAWSKGHKFICKSVCDKICRNVFGPDLEDRVWNRLSGTSVSVEDVPLTDREQALRCLGTSSSDERWLKLEEPPPPAFDVSSSGESDHDFFEEEYWTCDEDPDLGDEQVPDLGDEQVPDLDDEQVPDLGDESPRKRPRRDDLNDEPPRKRPMRDKRVKPPKDVCDRCHGNGCKRCGWKKNMW